MTYNILIKEYALEDTREAYEYYENVRPGLGERFLEQLENCYQAISLYSTYFGFIDDQKILLDKLLKVFPFVVIYKIEEDTVVVVAVHNCCKTRRACRSGGNRISSARLTTAE